ncbi:2-methylcitrate dehydratase [Polaromonas vacuolata]|uniref:2-methylcitrate dehydratase n=1 Tax=Polaromonas vacuolata TaxID=37448 RepID=A0A6H2HC55_9BURK|nr:MmgE/PrpD family protein [Polaromonas vacuolata]QJC57410.1 2-methylcitrate dehydratase [Polaromonas vacuolata]
MARNTQVSADHNAPPITQILAQFVSTHPSRGWSDALDLEAHRTWMNWLGCAVGATQHEAADAALAAVQMLQPAPQASVLGRLEKVDMASAALINGITSHTFDFDDTHLKTIIHPAGPVASALLALAEHTGSSGREVIDALVLGIDVACRVGNAMYPDHYDRGWHITGSTGTLGAAAACARLLKLDVQKTAMALGIAASQPIGMREQFGTMTKPFHPGAAARAGLMSALLASQGYTASPKALEAPRGMMQTISTKNDWNEITGELGQRFEIAFNSYKPFACGIVIHPSIDACAQLRGQGVTPDQIESVELKVHSLVLELTGKKEPTDGLQAKFSVYHGCAAGLTFGRAAEEEFADSIVSRDDMVALRRKVVATVDDSIDEASADVTAVLKDGRRVHVFVEHAIGSLKKPMSNAQLEAKFHSLSDAILGQSQTSELIKACFALGQAANVSAMVALAKPRV